MSLLKNHLLSYVEILLNKFFKTSENTAKKSKLKTACRINYHSEFLRDSTGNSQRTQAQVQTMLPIVER